MMLLRSEGEIISTWEGDINNPVVSICCLTFNHESYIENALEGFLIQETSFPFEVLVHDDASTDKTVQIIKKYQELYPKIIKPIFQTENQHQKGVKITLTFNYSRAKGEYIALCEGDDYWISPNKLQIQYEICREQRCAVVYHSANEVDLSTGSTTLVSRYRHYNTVVPLIHSVKGRGAFMPTASLFFPFSIIKNNYELFKINSMPVGDFFLQMILSYNGKIFYIDRPMCVYRRNAPGSWTSQQSNENHFKSYAYAMREAIIELYYFLDDKPDKYILAFPYAFYSIRAFYNTSKKEMVLGLLKGFVVVKNSKFKVVYFLELLKSLFKKIKKIKKI